MRNIQKSAISAAMALAMLCSSAFAVSTNQSAAANSQYAGNKITVASSDAGGKETAISKTVIATQDVNVRAGAGMNYRVLGTLSKGQSATVTAVSGSWYKITFGKSFGYVCTKFTKDKTQQTQPTKTKKTVKVTASSLKIRSGPGTTYSVLGSLKRGDKAKVIGISGDWYQIQLSKGTGYISKAYTRDLYKKVSVTAKELNVRAGAGTGYRVLGTLKKGASVRVVATSGDWYKIKYGSGYGYIKSAYTK